MFDQKKYFPIARKEFLEIPLREFGFSKYKTSILARLTDEGVFQFLDIQKSSGTTSFAVNVAIRPLFCPNYDSLTLLPGNRLGFMASGGKRDKWWICDTPDIANASFTDVLDSVRKHALPFFDATTSSAGIIDSYERNIFGKRKFGNTIAWGTAGWENFDLAHVYLKAGNYSKALRQLRVCRKEFRDETADWAAETMRKCTEIAALVEAGKQSVEAYLEKTTKESIQSLTLESWLS